MTAARGLRFWYLVHKWTGLICTAFVLILCITGLPLIFHDEIDEWEKGSPAYDDLPPGTSRAGLDRIAAAASAEYPSEAIRYIFIRHDEPEVQVVMAPSLAAGPEHDHRLSFDARSGRILAEQPPASRSPAPFIDMALRLHAGLFLGLPGELFLGCMGLVFIAAIVSGVALYGPFMRRLDFGTIRRSMSPRVKWIDLHNMIGIVTLAWILVVAVTGIINELSAPLFGLWRITEVEALLRPYRNRQPPAMLAPAQAALDTARRALPDRLAVTVVYPDPKLGNPHHYLVWTKGSAPLTARLFTPVLVDAQTGELTAVARLPWYLRALEISRPLHFGDYGSLPLKVIWALLDIATIIVLGSGLYLWLVRGHPATRRRVPEVAHNDVDRQP